jgi:RimJ/RimL family protein N-acetyltransferase
MDKGNVVLSVECPEPEGQVVRNVEKVKLSLDRFRLYYEKLSNFDTLFNDFIGDSFEAFVSCFIEQDESGELFAKGLLWQVDDVGILYITKIVPGVEAKAHFTFWDGRLKGREQLILEMCAHVVRKLHLHRLYAEVPLYALPTIKFVERLGFVKEGRMREAIRYKGSWFDVNLYSLLEHEVTNGTQN